VQCTPQQFSVFGSLSERLSPPPAQVAQGFFFSRPSSFSCRDFSVKLSFLFPFSGSCPERALPVSFQARA
jgi:hypothetical protein